MRTECPVRLRRCGAVLLLGLIGGAAHAEIVTLHPGEAWCKAVNDAKPGDEIHLTKGISVKPCTLRVKGAPGKPIVLRSASALPGQRAVVAYGGDQANVIDIRDSAHLVIQDLDITAKSSEVEGIKIYQAHDITIQRCRLHRLNGVAIAANHDDTEGLVIRGNEFKNLTATAIYLGCHDGKACRTHGALIENNVIDGVMPRGDDRVGYGLQIKLNSDAVIRDNAVYVTKGPGIMVYGNESPDGPASLIEGNLVVRSAWDGGIVIGGGPVVVRNNVAIDNGLAGIVAQDYQGRGLQHGIRILHNTLVSNLRGGIRVEHWRDGQGNVVANNLIAGTPEQPPISPPDPPGDFRGNAACPSASTCLMQPERAPYDVRVQPGSELRNSRELGTGDDWPKDDFIGLTRTGMTTPGAFEGRYPPELDRLQLNRSGPRPARIADPG